MKNFIFILLFFSLEAFCTQREIDSLMNLISISAEDTQTVNLYNQLSWAYKNSDFELARQFADSARLLAKKVNFNKGLAQSVCNLGLVEEYKGNYSLALQFYFEAMKIYEGIGYKEGIATTLNNSGIIHDYMGKYEKALEYYTKALEIFKETNNLNRIAGCMTNIGGIYDAQSQTEEALKYYKLAYMAYKNLSDNIGSNIVLNNMGMVFMVKKDYSKALKAFSEIADYRQKKNDQRGLLTSLINLSVSHYYLGNNKKAKEYSFKALTIAEKIRSREDIVQAYLNIADIFSAEKNFGQAYYYHKLYVQVKDSMFNEASSRQVTEMQTKYETEKKELEIENLNKDNEIKSAEIRKQNFQKLAFASGFALMFILAFIVFRGYRQKQKTNRIISAQKEEVEKQKMLVDEKNKSLGLAYKNIEEKNHEILDSIRYAKKIQEAILLPQKLVKQHLENSFILYKPKDIVAGDFYWMHPLENKVLFASVDCTGHGVPGAFVSILGHNSLNRCVKEFGLTRPAAILDKLCELIDEAFSNTETDIKDGMDIALCSYDFTNNFIEYAGAGNSLYHIRQDLLTECKADKQPVGKYAYRKPFSNQKIELQKNDAVYIFTDGYADQFGGRKGKKFKYSQFEKLILSIQDKSMIEQKEILNSTIENWKGELDQVDDICIIGIKI